MISLHTGTRQVKAYLVVAGQQTQDDGNKGHKGYNESPPVVPGLLRNHRANPLDYSVQDC